MATRAEHLAQLNTDFTTAEDEFDYADSWCTLGYAEWALGNDHNALNYLFGSVANLIDGCWLILKKNYPSSGRYSIPSFLADHTVAGDDDDFTLLTFIEAFINADDDHRSAHRLLLDAYQASMYDKPFDMEYHKNWVTRFKQWR